MKSHQVEVDDDVFQYVKGHAEPLVDSFNTAVRRLLNLNRGAKRAAPNTATSGANGLVPPGTPRALAQILEVTNLVIRGNRARTDATREVARRRQVTQQAVNDKYGRQLGLTAEQFDRLLGQPGLHDLKKRLNEKFPEHHDVINSFLS